MPGDGLVRGIAPRLIIVRVTTELSDVKARIGKIEKELQSLRQKVRSLEGRKRRGVPPFTKLEGAWSGANFTDEEIEAAEVRVRDVE